jgi:hypothetical protein
MTVAWADDIGYEVNYTAADTFNRSQLNNTAGCTCNRRLEHTTTTAVTQSNVKNIHQRQLSGVPKLSVEGYQTAVNMGMMFLSEQKLKRSNLEEQDGNNTSFDSNLNYVGDKFVWVYMRENSNVYSVLVKP